MGLGGWTMGLKKNSKMRVWIQWSRRGKESARASETDADGDEGLGRVVKQLRKKKKKKPLELLCRKTEGDKEVEGNRGMKTVDREWVIGAGWEKTQWKGEEIRRLQRRELTSRSLREVAGCGGSGRKQQSGWVDWSWATGEVGMKQSRGDKKERK